MFINNSPQSMNTKSSKREEGGQGRQFTNGELKANNIKPNSASEKHRAGVAKLALT